MPTLSLADARCRRVRLTVTAIDDLAPLVKRLSLAVVGDEPLRWLPGQYLELLLDDGTRRAFSIANAPTRGGHIDIHVRHVAGGNFTRRVFESMRVGDSVDAEGPLGTFVPRLDSERPIIFVAGGTGYAPIRAIVQHFDAIESPRSRHIYWGARTAGDFYLCDEARAWAANSPQLSFTGVVSEGEARGTLRRGMVHEAVVVDHPDLCGHDVYVCGPPAMIDAARHAFLGAGLPAHRLYFDTYEYAPDVLASILGNPHEDAAR